MTSARSQLLASFHDYKYRHAFVKERVRTSVALQIRALRLQRNAMSQKQLGEAIGMAQTWVSKLENPDYGKMTVATLLRLAEAFDTDIEIKFRPFSATIDSLSRQGPDYFEVPSFVEEFAEKDSAFSAEDLAKILPYVPTREQNMAFTQSVSSGFDPRVTASAQSEICTERFQPPHLAGGLAQRSALTALQG